MNVRVIRKGLILFLTEILLIIGIFVLQFRTDSNLIEKIGNLQLTLAETKNEDNISVLRNKLQVAYNGLTFYADDAASARALFKGNKEMENLKLISWKKDGELACTFNYISENHEKDPITITFELSDLSQTAKLSMNVSAPSNVVSFAIPYSTSYDMKILQEDKKSVVFENKKGEWKIQADSLDNGLIQLALGSGNAHASYSVHSEVEKFMFENVVTSLNAEESVYISTINTFRDYLISTFKQTQEANYTEQSVVAYVAASAEQGNYQKAIEDIPQTYKRSEKRTYLSAPYFNSLTRMDSTLDKACAEMAASISKGAANSSLDIFSARNIAFYLCIHPKSAEVLKLLNLAVNADLEKCDLATVTGFIRVYNDLVKLNATYAEILKPVIPSCLERIALFCTYNDDKLTISENDTFISVVQGVEIGTALLQYGLTENNQVYVRAGRVLINSYIAESSSFDLRTLTNIYPMLAFDNWYYPHFAKIGTGLDGNMMWAWTCSRHITSKIDDEGSLTLTIDFPINLTHYLITKNIPAFNSIYIYGMAFRTDPRFETYNSSGYVYKSETKSLLLKSRHKAQNENIRLVLSKTKPASEQKETEAAKKPKTSETPKATEKPAVEKTETKETAAVSEKTESDKTVKEEKKEAVQTQSEESAGSQEVQAAAVEAQKSENLATQRARMWAEQAAQQAAAHGGQNNN